MQSTILITFICDDRPGLVEQISSIIQSHQGNWLESKMAQLSGKFTGIIEVAITEEQIAPLKNDLEGLSETGMAILIEPAHSSTVDQDLDSNHKTGSVSILGLDRPGIVNEISAALAAHSINVESFHSLVEAAPMSSELLFKAELEISLPENTNLEQLDDQLDDIASSLDIEHQLSISY